MRVKFTDLNKLHQLIRDDLDRAISRVLECGRFIKGEEVRRFEEEFARFCQARYAIGCSSGTSALHTALWALGIGHGDEVLLPGHTFVATAEAILHTGATPVFVDIDEETYLIDPEKIESSITERTKAIIAVHLYGQPVDMDRLMYYARRHELWIIEDATQAAGAAYKGRSVGILGDVACFSFHPAKNLGALGDAGALVTNDTEIAEKSRRFVDHGRKEKYIHGFVGHNYRMDELQAAVLRVKLQHIKIWNEQRRSAVLRYKNALQDRPFLFGRLVLPKEYPGSFGVYCLFVVRTKERDRLQHYLQEYEIETGIHYPVPVHLQPAFKEITLPKGALPITEKIVKEIISLPLHPLITEEEILYVIDNIEKFFKNRSSR
ncbi:DegT/DnrJ/EryC1/StrS family aminotransferase [Candidatus Sumerlaeota bacterium]|nr:DegT/DnrJ/EryC1/StrS family aminotransferase [Candidatus Sumerlaeota bacterium]